MDALTLTQYNESQLKTIVYVAVKAALAEEKTSQQAKHQPFIKGIHGLAKFLKVSPARAQKLKNEGAFPFWQDGRTLLFDPEKVKEAMLKNGKG